MVTINGSGVGFMSWLDGASAGAILMNAQVNVPAPLPAQAPGASPWLSPGTPEAPRPQLPANDNRAPAGGSGQGPRYLGFLGRAGAIGAGVLALHSIAEGQYERAWSRDVAGVAEAYGLDLDDPADHSAAITGVAVSRELWSRDSQMGGLFRIPTPETFAQSLVYPLDDPKPAVEAIMATERANPGAYAAALDGDPAARTLFRDAVAQTQGRPVPAIPADWSDADHGRYAALRNAGISARDAVNTIENERADRTDGVFVIGGKHVDELRMPNARHRAAGVDMNSTRKNENTVYGPNVDVAGDLAAIKLGDARWINNEIHINERVYGLHENGTIYPIRGEGFYRLDRFSYKALGILNEYGVGTPEAERALELNRISPQTYSAAFEVWETLQ